VADNFLESIMWSPTDIMYSPIRKLSTRTIIPGTINTGTGFHTMR
jgi:hypothetical protein